MSERRARFFGLLASLDEARRRDFDITSALALSVLLTPAFEAFGASTQAFPLWFVETADKWTERLRLTRHDRERIPQILEMQEELLPARRRPATARGVTSRPSFKEALALYTLRLHQQQQPLDDVGMWKAVAASFGAPYRQMRLTERGPRQRATGRADGGGGGGSGGGGRGGRDRGRGRSRRRR